MNIYIASDHAGYEMKEMLKVFLQKRGYEVTDIGPMSYNPQDDYPNTIGPLAKAVSNHASSGEGDVMGIILGYSGQGEAIVANRMKGVRAGVYAGGSLESIQLMREHNDANVLSLGAHFLSHDDAQQAVLLFLDTPFSGEERHVRRIAELDV